jgi:hypothetical protein
MLLGENTYPKKNLKSSAPYATIWGKGMPVNSQEVLISKEISSGRNIN